MVIASPSKHKLQAPDACFSVHNAERMDYAFNVKKDVSTNVKVSPEAYAFGASTEEDPTLPIVQKNSGSLTDCGMVDQPPDVDGHHEPSAACAGIDTILGLDAVLS